MYNRFNALAKIASAVYVLDHMAPRNARRRAGGAKVYGKRKKRNKKKGLTPITNELGLVAPLVERLEGAELIA